MGAHQSTARVECSSSCEEKSQQLLKTMRSVAKRRNRVDETRDLLIEIEHLLKSGADPDAQDYTGKTSLHYLAMYWRQDLDNILKASFITKRSAVKSNRKRALVSRDEESYVRTRDVIQKFIVAKCDVNKADKGGKTSLHYAAMQGKVKIVRILLSAGAKPDLADSKKNTPLLLATKELCNADYFEVSRQLIEAGANFDVTKNGTTILHRVCQRGDERMFDLLLCHGASLTVTDKNGFDALLHAVKSNSERIVRKLIDAGANVNFFNETSVARKQAQSITALHIAITNDNLDMLKCLLKSGADPNQTNKVGRSTLSLASEVNDSKKMFQRIELLLSYGADLYNSGSGYPRKSPFELLVSKGRVAEVQLLLQRGLDIGKYSPRVSADFSPLHQAIISNRDGNMLSILLKYDSKGSFDLEHVDAFGRSLLCLAVEMRLPNSVKLLIDRGADVNHVNGRGRSPLELASGPSGYLPFQPKCVQHLLEAGAKLRNVIDELLQLTRSDYWNRGRVRSAQCILKYRILYESRMPNLEPSERVSANLPVELQPHYEKCTAEIDLLKNRQLHNSITYHDVLVDKKLYERVRDDRMYELLDEKNLESRFPLYGQELDQRFKNAKDVHKIWEEAVLKLGGHLKLDPDTYYSIMRNILKRLCPDDLQSVAES